MNSFGAVIRRARSARGWTLEYVASRTQSHKGYISGIENGTVNPPSAKMVLRIAKLYGMNEKELLLRAVVEKVPKEIREELESRVFGEKRSIGPKARRRERALRARAVERVRRAWQLAQEALERMASAAS